MKASAFIKKGNGVETAKTCRWCLSTCDDLELLPNDESGQYKLQKLFDCTGFQVYSLPGVPSFLCTKCESRLEKMYKFRWRCNRNIALVNGFTEKQNTAKNEADISKDHLGHSTEQTFGTNFLIKTEVTTPNAAHDLPLIQRSCTAHQVSGTHECYGNQPDDLFEAEENPIAIKLENEDVDEQDNHQTNPSELICQDREDPSATTNTCINDSASESIPNEITAIDVGKHLKVGRKRKKDQEKTIHQLRSYKLRSHQQVNNGINRNAHRKGHRNKQKSHCSHCSATSIQSSKLKIHIRTHTDEMPYACKICDRSFRSSELLRKHSVRHNKDHKCPHCTSKFALSSELKVHIRTHTLGKPCVCEVCDQAFRSLSNLAQHKKIHNKDQHHQCPHCPSKLTRLSSLNDHIRTHTGEKPYVCEVCDQAFRSLSNLAQHKNIHNKDQHHQCPHCPSKFARLSNLNDHVRTHTGKKPFVCEVCDQAFRFLNSLTRHKKIHNKDECQQCPHCPSKFARLSHLNDHVRTHTGKKPFVCEVCDQAFRFLNSLTRHKKIHNKDECQQCPHCPSKFARLSHLNDHVRTHTGKKPFVCRICKKAYYSSSALSVHSKIHKKNQ